MKASALSRNYKIRIGDAKISVAIDDSFYSTSSYEKRADLSAKYFHYHAAYEMFLCMDGGVTVYTKSGETEYSDTVVIIPPFFEHFSIRARAYRILFSIDSTGSSDLSEFLSGICRTDAILSICAPRVSAIYFDELRRALTSSDPLSDEVAELLLKLFFHKLYDESPKPKKPQKRTAVANYLTKIDSLIFNLEENVTLEYAARVLGLSTKQASRVIKKHYNASLSHLIMQRRLDAARRLLEATDMSISEIAENVNFHSESYFYNCFRREYGMTPRKYREAIGK